MMGFIPAALWRACATFSQSDRSKPYCERRNVLPAAFDAMMQSHTLLQILKLELGSRNTNERQTPDEMNAHHRVLSLIRIDRLSAPGPGEAYVSPDCLGLLGPRVTVRGFGQSGRLEARRTRGHRRWTLSVAANTAERDSAGCATGNSHRETAIASCDTRSLPCASHS